MKNNRRLAGLTIFLILGILGVVAFLGQRQGRSSLLAHARYVADTQHWIHSKWIDDRRILVLSGSNGLEAAILDTETGIRRPLVGLTATLRKIANGCYYVPSPDGKWLLVCQAMSQPFTNKLVRVSDGRVVTQVPGTVSSWLADSNGWITRSAGSGTLVSLPGPNGKVKVRVSSPASHGLGKDLLFTSRRTAITGDYSVYGNGPLRLQECDLNTGRSGPISTVTRPPSSYISNLSMSQDGKQLVWVAHPPVGPSRWLNRVMELLRRGEDSMSIWVSRADGTRMIGLGSCEVSYELTNRKNVSVEWLPGGKELAVTYCGRLYRLPVGDP
jgi:hypothetical protein